MLNCPTVIELYCGDGFNAKHFYASDGSILFGEGWRHCHKNEK